MAEFDESFRIFDENKKKEYLQGVTSINPPIAVLYYKNIFLIQNNFYIYVAYPNFNFTIKGIVYIYNCNDICSNFFNNPKIKHVTIGRCTGISMCKNENSTLIAAIGANDSQKYPTHFAINILDIKSEHIIQQNLTHMVCDLM